VLNSYQSDKFIFSVTVEAGSSSHDLNVPLSVVLSFKTFKEAADQAGFSRPHGGIHFQGPATCKAASSARKSARSSSRKAAVHSGEGKTVAWRLAHALGCRHSGRRL